jgi:hypothetical protein
MLDKRKQMKEKKVFTKEELRPLLDNVLRIVRNCIDALDGSWDPLKGKKDACIKEKCSFLMHSQAIFIFRNRSILSQLIETKEDKLFFDHIIKEVLKAKINLE